MASCQLQVPEVAPSSSRMGTEYLLALYTLCFGHSIRVCVLFAESCLTDSSAGMMKGVLACLFAIRDSVNVLILYNTKRALHAAQHFLWPRMNRAKCHFHFTSSFSKSSVCFGNMPSDTQSATLPVQIACPWSRWRTI